MLVGLAPTINQSGTAGYTALLINPTETATGTGAKNLIDAQVGGSSKFSVDNTGKVTAAEGIAPAHLATKGQLDLAISAITNRTTLTQATTAASTPDVILYSDYDITALAAGLTLSAPAVAPPNGTMLAFRLGDNGSARAFSWNSAYVGLASVLPTTTTAGKVMILLFRYSSSLA